MRRIATSLVMLSVGLCVAACGDRRVAPEVDAGAATGDEGGHCYADGTCNGSLECLSTYCVRPGSCYPGLTEDCLCAGDQPGTRTCNAGGAWGSCQCASTCGNDLCEAWEDGASCPADCGPRCGDGVCQGTETITSCPFDCAVLATEKLDILFMIDNSNSMEPKQVSLKQYFTDFIQPLASLPGTHDLHIGIVTSDAGGGAFTPPSCDTIGGDQGILQNNALGATCSTAHFIDSSSRYLSFTFDVGGVLSKNFVGEVEDAFACYASIGTGGCGFEQSLLSVQMALEGCAGAGCTQAQNAGFFRKDAYLAVVVLTDEDDCSAATNATLFDPAQTTLNSVLGPLTSYRCFEFGNLCNGADPGRTSGNKTGCVPGNKDSDPGHQLTPTADFASFLKGLKPQAPRMVYAAVIAAPPSPVSVLPDANGYPDLQPACTGAIGSGDPALRLAQFVDHFDGDRASFSSICQNDLQQVMVNIAYDLTQILP